MATSRSTHTLTPPPLPTRCHIKTQHTKKIKKQKRVHKTNHASVFFFTFSPLGEQAVDADADDSFRVASAPQKSSSSSHHKTGKAGEAGGVAARAAGARLLRHQHPAAVVTVPTAGTVISGWASDVGSLF
jgi:hypothetical protein